MIRQVQKTIAAFRDPDTDALFPLTSYIEHLAVENGEVTYILAVAPPWKDRQERIKTLLDQQIQAIQGVVAVRGILTAHVTQEASSQGKPQEQRTSLKEGRQKMLNVDHLGKIILIGSGKGGVGKSTVALNTALALAQKGLRVGILDADINGPSLPHLLGLLEEKPEVTEDKKIIPFQKYGLYAMSIGFLVARDIAMIWRGPMVQSGLLQLIRDVAWPPLDALLVDLPPGTGDIPLSLAQNVPVAGGVIVSTPQDLALADARRAVTMFNKLHVPILGIVQNMSVFVCPHCHQASHLFGQDGARKEALEKDIPFLGDIPLDIGIRDGNDAGVPMMHANTEHPIGKAFQQIAQHIWDGVHNGVHR